jgi:hypothetical protein
VPNAVRRAVFPIPAARVSDMRVREFIHASL